MIRSFTCRSALLIAGSALLLGLAGCDDQIKRVPWFETMYRQPSVETYEAPGRLPPEGAVALGAERHVPLLNSDSLVNPLAGQMNEAVLERGRLLYRSYCVMCHGETGEGDGPVVGQNRFPAALQTINLLTDRARGYTDGYIYGMIGNGRGLMPSYRRIPAQDRWYIVNYVRELQGNP